MPLAPQGIGKIPDGIEIWKAPAITNLIRGNARLKVPSACSAIPNASFVTLITGERPVRS